MISVLGKDVFSTVEEIVDPSHTALVMMAPAVERVSNLIAKARSVGVLPIFIQNQWLLKNRIVSASFLRFMIYKQGMDPKDGCTVSGTWGAEILPETGIRPDDLIVQKWRPSAFRSTNLDMLLPVSY